MTTIDPLADTIANDEANTFAMSLLMPSALVKAAWDATSGHFCDRVYALAERFEVEVPIMTLRLVQVGAINMRRAI